MYKYDPQKTWRENLIDAPPQAAVVDDTSVPQGSAASHPPNASDRWSWCGLSLPSPLGIPAGPLLDSKWLLYYAHLGFDWLVYKTVRTRPHPCHALPNLVPVQRHVLAEAGAVLRAQEKMEQTWAVSFGMPSQPPDVWRADVARARDQLPRGKRLIVSVVATQDPTIVDRQESLDQIAADYARCARWAADSGADGIVANFSCPNVTTADGQLYQIPATAGVVAERIREAIGGEVPLAIKIGSMTDRVQAERLIECLHPFVNGLVMTNSISARVQALDGRLMFEGHPRGICGDAIRQASVAQVTMFRELIDASPDCQLSVIGVGGVSTLDHVNSYLSAGAECVGLATAAMLNPRLGLDLRRELYSQTHSQP